MFNSMNQAMQFQFNYVTARSTSRSIVQLLLPNFPTPEAILQKHTITQSYYESGQFYIKYGLLGKCFVPIAIE